MSVINNISYTGFPNINLKQGVLRFGASHAAMSASTDYGIYVKSDHKLYFWDRSSEHDITATAGATAYNSIGDAAANGSITMGAYTGTYTSATANWGGMIISNTHANPTSGSELLHLDYTADGDAHGVFLVCQDNSSADEQFKIGAFGTTTIAGEASGTDSLTQTKGDHTISDGMLVMTTGGIDINSTTGNALDVNASKLVIANATGKITGGSGADIELNTNKFTVDATNGNTVIAGTCDITGATGIDGNFDIATNKFTVTAASGNTAIAGTLDVTGNVTMAGTLTVTGALTYGGTLTINDTVTADELILDTDGVAPAGTNCYWVRDNAGDLTGNAITGKVINLAINNTDEYAFSAAKADFNGNSLDNCGYVILNADTAPAATEVYLVNDNSGDLTLNALSTKKIELAIAGTNEISIAASSIDFKSAGSVKDCSNLGFIDFDNTTIGHGDNMRIGADNTGDLTINAANGKEVCLSVNGSDVVQVNGSELEMASGADIQFLGNDGILDSAGNEVVLFEAVGSAVNYLNIKNAATANHIVLECQGTADRGFIFMNDQDEEILTLEPVATALYNFKALSAASGDVPTLQSEGAVDIGMAFETSESEEMLVLAAAATATNNFKITNAANGNQPKIETEGSSDANIVMNLAAKGDAGFNFTSGTVGDAARPDIHLQSDADTGLYGGTNLLGISTGGTARALWSVTGVKYGGTADHATTAGTNVVSIFNGTAPVGTLTNGISFYSAGGECFVIDAGGTATQLSPHNKKGEYVINSYSAQKKKTLQINIEGVCRKLAEMYPQEFGKFIKEFAGRKALHEKVKV